MKTSFDNSATFRDSIKGIEIDDEAKEATITTSNVAGSLGVPSILYEADIPCRVFAHGNNDEVTLKSKNLGRALQAIMDVGQQFADITKLDVDNMRDFGFVNKVVSSFKPAVPDA